MTTKSKATASASYFNIARNALDKRIEKMQSEERSVRDLIAARKQMTEASFDAFEKRFSKTVSAEQIASAYTKIAQKALVKLSRVVRHLQNDTALSNSECKYIAMMFKVARDSNNEFLSVKYHAVATKALSKSESTTTTQLSQCVQLLQHFDCIDVQSVDKNVHKISFKNDNALTQALAKIA